MQYVCPGIKQLELHTEYVQGCVQDILDASKRILRCDSHFLFSASYIGGPAIVQPNQKGLIR